MIIDLLIAASVASGLAAIVADRGGRRHPSFYALKPLTTVLIFALAFAQPVSGATEVTYRNFVLVALALSLLGDIALMWDSNKAFMAGLSSFFLAHLAFVVAFTTNLHAVSLPGWLAIPLVYAAVLLVILLPRAGSLKVPVLFYCVVLAAMVFSAAARHAQFGGTPALLALLGALLFMASDSLLALRRFVKDFRGAQAAILSTYWLAIGLIAISA